MGDERKEFFKLQNKLKKEIYGKVDKKRELLEDLGFIENIDKKNTAMSYKNIT